MLFERTLLILPYMFVLKFRYSIILIRDVYCCCRFFEFGVLDFAGRSFALCWPKYVGLKF
ncbi:hypothetical protein Pint_07135 [Pistacia integerrima]|uniref:Uncharacterized protein n=1 Tax=Pistacia integerrima TaxID=434235 RepID=A0ACC0XYD9_9ROSI|nr:hypothetical protein Pint_07135 [Pistacia integerrima]